MYSWASLVCSPKINIWVMVTPLWTTSFNNYAFCCFYPYSVRSFLALSYWAPYHRALMAMPIVPLELPFPKALRECSEERDCFLTFISRKKLKNCCPQWLMSDCPFVVSYWEVECFWTSFFFAAKSRLKPNSKIKQRERNENVWLLLH